MSLASDTWRAAAVGEQPAARWWQEMVPYENDRPSLTDRNGGGLGNPKGLIDTLDHFARMLGVTATWVGPEVLPLWLDRGADGVRLNFTHMLMKRPTLPYSTINVLPLWEGANTAFAGSSTPDLINASRDWIGEIANAGFIKPLDSSRLGVFGRMRGITATYLIELSVT